MRIRNFIFCLFFLFFTKTIAAQELPFLIYTTSSGMFATVSSVLGALDFYETGHYPGIKVDLERGGYWDPKLGPNWWDYFFEPIHIGDETRHPIYVFSVADHRHFVGHTFTTMPKERAGELIHRYVKVKPEILHKVKKYYNRKMKDYYVIGVHYRGTDKIIETPLVSYQKMRDALFWIYNSLSNKDKARFRIYLATDDQNFLDELLTWFPRRQVIYNHFVRSSDNRPIHYGNDDKFDNIYQKGEEALLDCLLLSKCHLLVRTESTLSRMAERFNIHMPVHVVQP